MGLKLVNLTDDRKKLVIPFGEAGDLTLTYRPNGLTYGTRQSLTIARRDDDEVAAEEHILDVLLAVIVEWDLEGPGGSIVPLTKKGLKALPVRMPMQLLEAINEDSRPNGQSSPT